MVDFAILSQVWFYRENTSKRRKSEGNHLNSWHEDESHEISLLKSCEECKKVDDCLHI